MHADTVIDGVVVELKTVSGNRATLGKSFRRGYKQGSSLLKKHGITSDHSVFLRIFTPFSVDSVRAKIAGELKNSTDKGYCICYFEATEQLFYWAYDELRAIRREIKTRPLRGRIVAEEAISGFNPLPPPQVAFLI